MGHLSRLLPQACFIHLYRHPLDTCLSLFKRDFDNSHIKFANDLDVLGAYYAQCYVPLMRHWHASMPDSQLLGVSYENFVRNPYKEIGEKMAELNISERQVGDVTLLDMSGKITIGEGSVALRTAIRRLLEEGKKKILLNLAGVGYIDSSGIGELVSSYTAINNAQGQLKLLSLTEKLRDLLAITKLLTVFDTYESEEEALSSFK